MSNVVKFKPAEFVNINGKPITVNMKQFVLKAFPTAWVRHSEWKPSDDHARHACAIVVPEYANQPPRDQPFLGTGATEDAAWRAAYFRLSGGTNT